MTVHHRTGSRTSSRPVLRNTAMLSASAAIALMAAGCATAASEGTKNNTNTKSSSSSSTATGAEYEDGTYSADGEYTSPGGQQSVSVELTLKDGAISDLTVTPGAVDSQSQRFQKDFAENVADQVVGKSLDEADVSVVASSSLTSEGFNEALAKIAEEAVA